MLAGERLSETIHLRMTALERESLAREAERHGLSVSDFSRRILREAAGFGPMLDGEDRQRMSELAEQIRAVGVNLNQAVRKINSGRMPAEKDLASLLRELAELFSSIRLEVLSLCARARRRRLAALSNSEDGS